MSAGSNEKCVYGRHQTIAHTTSCCKESLLERSARGSFMCCGRMHTVTVKVTGSLLTWEEGTVWHLLLYCQKCAGHCCSWFDSTHRQIQRKLIVSKDDFSMCAFLSFHKGEAEPWRKAAIKEVRVSCLTAHRVFCQLNRRGVARLFTFLQTDTQSGRSPNWHGGCEL